MSLPFSSYYSNYVERDVKHQIIIICYTPDIGSMWGYIVFAFSFVRSFVCTYVRSFVHLFVLLSVTSVDTESKFLS